MDSRAGRPGQLNPAPKATLFFAEYPMSLLRVQILS